MMDNMTVTQVHVLLTNTLFTLAVLNRLEIAFNY